jgi:ligand-binding sensor domain-containing protein
MLADKACYFIRYYTFFALLTVAFTAAAQNAHPTFRKYDIENGLPSSEIYQVKQDSKGYLWFATNYGVSRFNGYEFENFSMADGLPDNTVFEIHEDPLQRIWFIPLSCRLSYYQNGVIHQYPFNDALLKKLKNNPQKTSFFVDAQENVFIGIIHNGIYKISAKGDITLLTGGGAGTAAPEFLEPQKGSFVYSSGFGNKLKSVSLTQNGSRKEFVFPDSIWQKPDFVRILRLKNNNLLLSVREKLFVFGAEGAVIKQKEMSGAIIWLYEDADEGIWVGIQGGGVYYFKNNLFTFVNRYLTDVSVSGVLKDREGGYWFTTLGNAVYYTPSLDLQSIDKLAGLASEKANALATDGQYVYAGMQNGQVLKLSGSNVIKSINANIPLNLPGEIFKLHYIEAEKRLLICANRPTGYIKNGRLFKEAVCNMQDIELEGNRCWYVSSAGLYKCGHIKGVPTRTEKMLLRKRTAVLLRKDAENLFVGTADGLWLFNTITEISSPVAPRHALLRQRVLDLAYAHDGSLLVATKGAGLLIYNSEGIRQITRKEGLCGDNIGKIIRRDNIVLLATNEGLNKIEFTANNTTRFIIKSYTAANGLASNEINDVAMLHNHIYVATNKGITVFDAGKADSGITTPISIYSTEVLINEQKVLPAAAFALRYFENNIKIKFTGISYKKAGKLSYRYQMVGLSGNWIYTNSREVQFTNLAAGSYDFMLCCQNPDGNWGQPVKIASFTIATAFWKTWWFYVLSITLLVGTITWFINYRYQLARKEREKEAFFNKNLLSLKLKALRAQMNPHFTFNVMNAVQQYITSRDVPAANKYLTTFAKLIRSILNNSEKNTIPLQEELTALELYIQLEAMRFDNAFSYKIIIDKNINPAAVEIPSMLIQPYVENAIKHGILPLGGDGSLKIELVGQPTFIKCIIEDNGIGRAAAQLTRRPLHQSLGTSITKQRLAAINNLYNSGLAETITDLTDKAGQAAGTRVEIIIPTTLDQVK